MRPLRIAHVVTSLVAGGAQRQEIALAERLPRDRFVVDFLAVGGPGPYDERARAAGARVLYLGTRRQPGESRLAGQRRRLGMRLNYLRAVRRGHYDIVDAWLYPDDVLAATMRFLTGTPIVMSGRRNIQAHDRLGPLAGPIDRVVARLTDAVVANSEAAARFAVASHHTDPSRLHVIRNGVDLVEPLSAAERALWRRRMGTLDDDFVIGCVGRYRPIKGQALLIDAVARLAPSRPHLRLVIVGEGELRAALEDQVRALGLLDRVRLHGNEHDPRTMYGAFDLVAQASISEGLPNALLEAAAAGRPIVATDAGGTEEIVIDGRTGLLVPTGSIDALADGLRRAVDDPELRQRLGRAAREHVEATFSLGRFAQEYGDLYEALAASKGLRTGGESQARRGRDRGGLY
jgi:glycosyltransferase involved in cell wall biosynthesis